MFFYIEKLARFIDNDHWFPSRQKVYRTLKAHRSVIPDIGYWIRVFPPFKRYLEHQFDDEYLRTRRQIKSEERESKRIKKE